MTERSKEWLQRWAFFLVLIAFLHRYFSCALLHQIQSSPILFPYVDLTYWLAHYLQIPQLIARCFWLASSIDIGIFISAFLSLIFINKNIFPILYTLLFSIYFICFNSYTGHHTHFMIGLLMIGIPFCFYKLQSIRFMWEGLRYFTIWIYASAFMWKIARGAWLNFDHANAVVQSNLVTSIYFQPESWYATLGRFFINHPNLLFALYVIAVGIEGLMILGFFTKKYDKLLFILPILLHTGTLFFIDVFFYELLILNLTFIKMKSI